MATANFRTMEHFPLIVAADPMCRECPECGCFCGEDEKVCSECGASLDEAAVKYDEIAAYDLAHEMEQAAKDMNEYLTFHKVVVESGYYNGLQFYVEEDFHDYCSIEDIDNEYAQYYYGMCRSKMLRKYHSEVNWLNRRLRKVRDEMGLMELAVYARFSNGETMYTKIDPKKGPTLRQAVKIQLAKETAA